MAVNLIPAQERHLEPIAGVDIRTAATGIKYHNRDDLTIFRLTENTAVGAVFTQNRFCAAPVVVARKHLSASHGQIRALIVNTGNANAGMGRRGLEDAHAMCDAAAAWCGCLPAEVLPFSTGVILEGLPIEKITAAKDFQAADWARAASAIMTTDTIPKAASRTVNIDGKIVRLTGIAKGSGMICPNMATMLGFVFTDALIDADLLQDLTQHAADQSFNAITVDGDTSTNDSFVVAATGQSGVQIDQGHTADFQAALNSLSLELAQSIIRDGEGATKFITIITENAANTDEARRIGYAVAHSPLVKTAFYASDPNLGRILCAIGYAAPHDMNMSATDVFIGQTQVIQNGMRAGDYTEEDGVREMAADEITIRINLKRGDASAIIYTCDLSKEYVAINADYRS